MAIEERVSWLEGIIEAITSRLDSMDSRITSLEARMDARFNTLTTITVAMWVTTMLAVVSTLAAVLLQG
jgi:flagellar capping protein FliD